MARFGPRSERELATCHPLLQRFAYRAIEIVDFAITEGHRDQEKQDSLYPEFTKVKWPNGRHNQRPSLAFDWVPWPFDYDEDWNDVDRFTYYGGIFIAVARIERIPLRWGGDWNRNDRLDDQRFNDYPHVELIPELI